jgi:cell division control protein 7
LKIIHRDVKPSNFMFRPSLSSIVFLFFDLFTLKTEQYGRYNFDTEGGVFRLIDFGLAEKEQSKLEHRHELANDGPTVKRRQVGYVANRGGTKGFRAPEVLLKVVHQTTAIDIWSCGIIFLSMLCCRYPVLSPSDDDVALLEIIAGIYINILYFINVLIIQFLQLWVTRRFTKSLSHLVDA